MPKKSRNTRVLHLYLPAQLWADLEYVTAASVALGMSEIAREAMDLGLAALAARRGLPWPRPTDGAIPALDRC